MTVTNDFQTFATGAGANVVSPATWASTTARFTGFQAGQASSALANTALRQANFVTAMIAQFVADTLAQSVADNGNLATLESQFISAIQQSVGSPAQAAFWHFGHDTGPVNVMQVAASPVITAYADGMVLATLPQFSNTTTTPTLSSNGLSAAVVVHADGTALNVGDNAANTVTVYQYDAPGTRWRIISQATIPQSALVHYGADVGTANAILVSTVSPAVAAVTTGMQFEIKKGAASNTGALTANIVGTSAAVTWGDGTALSGLGPEWPAGADGIVVYDGNYKLVGPPSPGAFIVPGTPAPLLAPRTYYVDGVNGNDSNNGLAAGAGNAFASLTKVMTTILSLNMNGFGITVITYPTTYAPVACPPLNGSGTVSFTTPTPTVPASTIIAATTGEAAYITGRGYSFTGFTFTSAANGSAPHLGCGIRVGGGAVALSNCAFGACSFAQILSEFGATVGMSGVATGSPSSFINIVGAAPVFMYVDGGGTISTGQTILTVTGTPAFSAAFALATTTGSITLPFSSITGTATGSRYSATLNGVISTNGSGSTYYPGNAAGTTSTGGQYL